MTVPDPIDRFFPLLPSLTAIGSEMDLSAVLQRIVELAVELVDARYGALGVIDESGQGLSEFITVGMEDDQVERMTNEPRGDGVLGVLIVDPKPLRLRDIGHHPESYGFPDAHPVMRSFLGVPVHVRDSVFGNLYMTDKMGADEFTDEDEQLLVALAAAAGVAIDNVRLHARVAELALLEDRERIARDLHDTVIQRIFATGLSLRAAVELAERDPAATADRIDGAIEDLDGTVRQIRSVIFGLARSRPDEALAVRIEETARAARDMLGFDPVVRFVGPVESVISTKFDDDLLATVGEALSNVARHARAHQVDVVVTATDQQLSVTVTDDGVGVGARRPEGRGIANMTARAQRHGGECGLDPGSSGGSVLHWAIPLSG